MNYTTPFPAMPGKPLDYWLDSDMARMAPETTTSALRDMAWAYGQWRGFAVAMTGLGTAVLAGGLLALIMMRGAPGLWISLILGGLALLCVSIYITTAKLPKIARAAQPRTSRAPGRTASGLSLAALMVFAVGGPMALALHGWLSEGPGPAISFVVVALLFLLGIASVFVGPAYCAQHARQGFRGYINKSPALRQELEALSSTWHDPSGNRSFGPL
ncbi:hypothetical protein SAMN04489740_3817 [Arthrobacter alpinus]|uniref:Uncharacterized protein n=1 Tax=Arthrobacter alpinus TaxID=656366 RepID=A0A1H5NL62_9MICC|nr:hypothetical protein [Arthrobacter alpinus]SEF02382.1 hypothetical protein SAMN04489740_3817 [Arthrobacter alpinus]